MRAHASVTVALGQFEDLVASGLRALIKDSPSLELVASDVPGRHLAAMLQAHRPDVAVLDLTSVGGPLAVRELAAGHPATHLVVLANEPTSVECTHVLGFGAAACVSKASQKRDILNAIHLAARGIQLTSSENGPPNSRGELLTGRESDVLALLQQNRTNAQIAAELHIGLETVRTHARNIYRKLGVASRRELIAPGAGAPSPARYPAARSSRRAATVTRA
jgi:DNA-binding NarL/FixJ family response regulator